MGATVLVVDDDPGIRGLLADLLDEEGYAVRTARDGEQALAEVEQEPADLILSDVAMPRLGGVGLAARLRERGDRTPVVLMSAAAAAAVPGIPFVPKPFDLDQVVAVVHRALAGGRGTVG